MVILFVGDVDSSLAQYAKNIYPTAELITKQNFIKKTFPAIGYTSLGDLQNTNELKILCDQSDEIFYVKIKNNKELDLQTRNLLNYIKNFKPVYNLDNLPIPEYILQSIPPPRLHNKVQMWTVGGSDMYGVGVEKQETVGQLLHDELNVPWTDLSAIGSGVEWCANQICLLDLNKGDVVFWGINSYSRVTLIENQKLIHVTASTLNNISNKKCIVDYFNSDTNFYNTYCAVKRAQRYCDLNKAHLITIGTCPDYYGKFNQLPLTNFMQSVYEDYIDIGNDLEHPGPKQHKQFAKDFEKLYKRALKSP